MSRVSDKSLRNMVNKGMRAQMNQLKGRESTVSEMIQTTQDRMKLAGANLPFMPSTFVPLPLKSYPLHPTSFLKYQWYRSKSFFTSYYLYLSRKWDSRKSLFSYRWKPTRKQIAPTAQVMYQEMLEAFASGDKPTLDRLCQRGYAGRLRAGIDKRPPGETWQFRLVKWNGRLFYPKLVSLMQMPAGDDRSRQFDQAVVALASTQELVKVDKRTGETIPGTTKVQDKVEYVVMNRVVDIKEWDATDWKIWGTTKPVTLEEYERDVNAVEREEVYKAGWNSTTAGRKRDKKPDYKL